MSLRSVCALTVSSVFALLVSVSPSEAALLADLRGNYQTTAVGNSTAAFDGGLGLPDTFGTGHWNYGKTAPGVFTPPAAMTLLTFYSGGQGGNANFPGYGDASDAGFFRIPLVGIDKHFVDGATPAANQITFHPNNAGTGSNDFRWTAGAGEAGLVTIRGTLDRTGEPGGQVTLFTYVDNVLVNTLTNVANGQSASFAIAANIAVGSKVDVIASPNACCGTESKLSLQIFSAGVNPVVNGSFEFPTPIAPGNNFDQQVPTGWTFVGSSAYPRIGSGGFSYPAAADGTTIYAVEGQHNGVLFQDLGTMIAGETYTFNGVVSSSNGSNSFRASFISDPLGAALEAAFITQTDFNPGAGVALNAFFSYTATAADAGKMLRLALSDNNTTNNGTRSAFDKISVSVTAAPVPEPAALSLLALGGLALARRRRHA